MHHYSESCRDYYDDDRHDYVEEHVGVRTPLAAVQPDRAAVTDVRAMCPHIERRSVLTLNIVIGSVFRRPEAGYDIDPHVEQTPHSGERHSNGANMARDARLELEAFFRDEIGDLRRLLINEAITPSEKALLLIALELSELRKTLAELLARDSAAHHADRVTADVN